MRKFPALLTAATVAALLFAVSQTPAQGPFPYDMESILAQSPTITALSARLAKLESAGSRPADLAPPSTKATAKIVRRADGTCVCQVCDANSCREYACDCSACGIQNISAAVPPTQPAAQSYYVATACPTCPGGVSYRLISGSPGTQTVYAVGDCASGSCGASSDGDSGGYTRADFRGFFKGAKARRANRRGGGSGGGCASCGG